MTTIIEKIEKYIKNSIEKSKNRYPIVCFYKEFSTEIFDKFTLIENALMNINGIKTLRLARLAIDKHIDSFYSSLLTNCRRRSRNFISETKKIIIIDSFIPIGIESDLSYNREIVGFIMSFYNPKSPINLTNTFLILGMTESNKIELSSKNVALRRYFANDPVNIEGLNIAVSKNETKTPFIIDGDEWPMENPSSAVSINPLDWVLSDQLIKYDNVDPSNDSLVRIIKNYSEINLILSRFPVIKDEFILEDIFNQPARELLEVQKFNIVQTLMYLKKLSDKIKINEINEN